MQEFENTVPTARPEPQNTWFAHAPNVISEEMPAETPLAVPTKPAELPVDAPVQPAQTPTASAQPSEVPVRPAESPAAWMPAAGRAPVYAQPYGGPAPAHKDAPRGGVAKAPRKKGGKLLVGILSAVLVVALILGSSGATMFFMNKKMKASDAQYQARLTALEKRLTAAENKDGSVINAVTIPAGQPAASGDQMTPAQVYAANLNSVVLINNVISNGLYSSGGTGSGFILTESGYVVTNHHVIEGGGKLSVVTADGTEYPAELIGSDNANDVAVLKIEAEGLRAVTLGDSDALTVGDQVVAIGNPLGELTSTLTVGYVSAKERDVNTSGFAINMLQTDAAINSGNSGGPLFNMYGHVVGITTAKYSGSSSSGATIEGIGFAIPINDVQGMLEDLVAHGYVVTPYLGVSVSDMDSEGAAYYGLPMGAYVNSVEEGFCAEKAGVLAKDIIVKVGEYEVDSVNSLSRALRNFAAGDTVELTVFRSGAEKTLTVTLDEKPANVPNAQQGQTATTPQEEEGFSFDFSFPGFG